MKREILLAFACLFATAAQANAVTVVARGNLNSFSDPEGLLPFTEADALKGFEFSVTYDDLALDLLPDVTQIGIYAAAVRDIRLTVGTVEIPAWPQRGLVIMDDLSSSNGTLLDFWIANSLRSPEQLDAAGNTRTWLFEFYLYGPSSTGSVGPLSSDALVEPPSLDTWTGGRIRYRIEDEDPEQNLLAVPAEAVAFVDTFSVTEVPLPATAWLLPAAFAAAGLRARRH